MLVDTKARFDELRNRLVDLHRRGWPEPVGYDLESFGPSITHGGKSKPDATRHRIAGYSIAFLDGARYYVPLRHPEQQHCAFVPAPTGTVFNFEESYQACEPRWKLLAFLAQPVARVWVHNWKFELAVLTNEGISVGCVMLDSEIAAWMAGWKLDGKGGLKLKPLAEAVLGDPPSPSFNDVARGRASNEVPAAEMAPYAADDPWKCLRLGEAAYKRVVELDSVEHFNLEMRCVRVTEHMERTGVPIDRAYLLAEADRCEAEAASLARSFELVTQCEVDVPVKVKRPKRCGKCNGTAHPPAGCGLSTACEGDGRKACVAGMAHHKNGKPVLASVEELGRAVRGARVGSDAEVSRWLFNELRWWPIRKDHPTVEYGHSVKEEHIRRFAALDGPAGEACRIRLRYQALRKYASTYTRTLVELADQSGDGRLHTSYKQDGTATSRYTSSMPNQANLPRSERQPLPWMGDMPDVRKAFLPSPGWKTVIYDFSQIELRIAAHYSRDPNLMACYLPQAGETPVDVHERTRVKMGAHVQRGDAKITNFSTLYLISKYSLASKLAMGTNDFESYTPAVAQGYINAFFEAYPKVLDYHERAANFARERGYATSLTGFKRPIAGWNERRLDKETGQSYSRFGECKRMAVNVPIQASAGGILKRALVALYEQWSASGLLGTTVRIQAQVYDEVVVECAPEHVERVSTDIQRAMEGAAPELRVPIVAEGGAGQNWSEAKG